MEAAMHTSVTKQERMATETSEFGVCGYHARPRVAVDESVELGHRGEERNERVKDSAQRLCWTGSACINALTNNGRIVSFDHILEAGGLLVDAH